MIRTQIQLTEEQAEWLKRLAHQSRQSTAALLRQALDQFLTRQRPNRRALYRRALAAVGKYRAEPGDVARQHDRCLAEVYHP